MKSKSVLLFLALCLFPLSLYAADNANIGTWKLVAAKSKFSADAIKNTTVIYADEGDKIKVTTYGINPEGKAVFTEWIGKFDKQDYPVTGDVAPGTTRSYKKVNNHTLELTAKHNGDVTSRARITVSADDASQVVSLENITPDGDKTHSKSVYDRE